LTPIEGEHRSFLRKTGKRAVDHCPRNPGGRGFARHRRKEDAKIASAFRRACGRSEKECAKTGSQSTAMACISSTSDMASSHGERGKGSHFSGAEPVQRLLAGLMRTGGGQNAGAGVTKNER
jgi:hypothetical protein